MKIATWNCNSVRARQARLLAWVESAKPDVLCLQELKCLDADFPTLELKAAGYHAVANCQKAFNGVAILSREEPKDVLMGLSDSVEDPQARMLAVTVGGIRVITVYAPNGQSVGSEAYQYKLAWYERLLS